MLLNVGDPVPGAPRRILVVGVTGVGKSTFCELLSERTGIPHVEIDGLFWGSDWTKRPEFEADVDGFLAQPGWITEWQYSTQLGDLLPSSAELVVWLDLPRTLARRRLIRRTIRRRLRREVLWNGNVEPPLHVFFTDPQRSILRWEMQTHGKWRRRMPGIVGRFPDLPIVRLSRQAEIDAWLDSRSPV